MENDVSSAKFTSIVSVSVSVHRREWVCVTLSVNKMGPSINASMSTTKTHANVYGCRRAGPLTADVSFYRPEQSHRPRGGRGQSTRIASLSNEHGHLRWAVDRRGFQRAQTPRRSPWPFVGDSSQHHPPSDALRRVERSNSDTERYPVNWTPRGCMGVPERKKKHEQRDDRRRVM